MVDPEQLREALMRFVSLLPEIEVTRGDSGGTTRAGRSAYVRDAATLVAAARFALTALEQGEEVEATEKWFGVAKHPIPYMKPGRYLIVPAALLEEDDPAKNEEKK